MFIFCIPITITDTKKHETAFCLGDRIQSSLHLTPDQINPNRERWQAINLIIIYIL